MKNSTQLVTLFALSNPWMGIWQIDSEASMGVRQMLGKMHLKAVNGPIAQGTGSRTGAIALAYPRYES
jgi:hypothetical protein